MRVPTQHEGYPAHRSSADTIPFVQNCARRFQPARKGPENSLNADCGCFPAHLLREVFPAHIGGWFHATGNAVHARDDDLRSRGTLLQAESSTLILLEEQYCLQQ